MLKRRETHTWHDFDRVWRGLWTFLGEGVVFVDRESVPLEDSSSANDEVVDQHDHCDDQDQVNECSAHMERKTQ